MKLKTFTQQNAVLTLSFLQDMGLDVYHIKVVPSSFLNIIWDVLFLSVLCFKKYGKTVRNQFITVIVSCSLLHRLGKCHLWRLADDTLSPLRSYPTPWTWRGTKEHFLLGLTIYIIVALALLSLGLKQKPQHLEALAKCWNVFTKVWIILRNLLPVLLCCLPTTLKMKMRQSPCPLMPFSLLPTGPFSLLAI